MFCSSHSGILLTAHHGMPTDWDLLHFTLVPSFSCYPCSPYCSYFNSNIKENQEILVWYCNSKSTYTFPSPVPLKAKQQRHLWQKNPAQNYAQQLLCNQVISRWMEHCWSLGTISSGSTNARDPRLITYTSTWRTILWKSIYTWPSSSLSAPPRLSFWWYQPYANFLINLLHAWSKTKGKTYPDFYRAAMWWEDYIAWPFINYKMNTRSSKSTKKLTNRSYSKSSWNIQALFSKALFGKTAQRQNLERIQ